MYKALDVREVSKCYAGRVNNEIYGHGGQLTINETTYIVVIAENLDTRDRKRFSFYPPRKEEFLDEMCYYGYTGDYDVLVPGDFFEVEDTNTWTHVRLIIEEN